MAGLSAEEKRKLLAEMLKKSGQAAPRIYPLASGQKALWLLHQQDPESAAYNTPFALRIRSEVDVAALKRSFEMLAARHACLRTTFAPTPDGQLLQTVHSQLAPHFAVHDTRNMSAEQLHEAVVIAYRRPFSLERGPLLRGDLFTSANDDHVLLITVHHIVYDGWSAGILQQELSQTYIALSKGLQSAQPPITGSYADFVSRQAELVASPRGRAHWDYWQRKLSGELPALALPADRARSAQGGNRSGAVPFKLGPELTQAVKALAKSEETTPFVVLVSAYAAMLGRLARQDDLVIGSPTTGRSGANVHDVVGYFANPVALRADLSGAPSTKALVHRMKEVVHEALSHQDFPFASIVERLDLERKPGVSPIFQASMTFQASREGGAAMDLWSTGDEEARIRWGHVEMEPYPLKDQEGQFDLTLEMWEARGALAGAFRYNRDLFDDDTVRRWRGYFETLLSGMVKNPDEWIAKLSLGLEETPASAALAISAPASTISSWFEKQVSKTPSAIALTFNDVRLTYAELNARANVVAHDLVKIGVRAESLVGVCVERSVELVVAILGVLKAGGAYVPLDPASPRDRLALILEDAEVSALITESKRKADMPDVRSIYVDTVRWDDPRGRENPAPALSPENAAYVIYTSGSTGRPKGVIVTHANATRLFTATEHWYHFDASDVWTLFHSAAFDFSVWELWGPLLYGGRLVVIPHWMTRSPEAFAELIAKEQVTVLNQTPSAFRALCRAPLIADGTGGRSLKWIIFGGEAMDAATIRPWFEKYGEHSTRLINMYGITETTVHVTYHPVTDADLTTSASPIGVPIPDLEIRLLDEHQNAVPVGVPGEIYVGGAGVARGYLKRPELTAQRFIPDPKDPKKTLYRSGDLAIRLPDNTYNYLGRIDHQVKIRGFRIELGEIQSVIAEHPAVAEAFVNTYELGQDDKRIVAYVVPKEGASAEVAASDGAAKSGAGDTHVGEWKELYDELYARSNDDEKVDASFNIAGWNSSYSGGPLSKEAMGEWVDHTVAQVLATKPSSIFEIGCGTGLLLTRIAPSTTAYWGTDVSPVVVNMVKAYCRRAGLAQVELFHKAADLLDEIPFGDRRFTGVIINSVAQYFPSAEYFARALESAAKRIEDGGFIFAGDIRNYRLLEAFHASIVVAQSTGTLDAKTLKERIARRMAGEEELVVHPDFFWALKQRIPRISYVEVRPKRGVCFNELTRFRYDVMIHFDRAPLADAEIAWGPGDLSLPELRTRLSKTVKGRVGLRGIRNARVQAAIEAASLAHDDGAARSGSIERLRRRVLDRDGSTPALELESGIDPEALHQLAQALSMDVALDWSRASSDGSFDAVFSMKGLANDRPLALSSEPPAPASRLANDPLRGRLERRLETELRKKTQDRLPDYMVPASIMVIDKIPLTENGKVDRRALPVPVASAQHGTAYVDPRTGEEEILASIFSELLGAERVGVHDSFFELGGHSLLATQVVSRIRGVFSVDLPLRALFDGPTVAQLAKSVGDLRKRGGALAIELEKAAERPAELPLSPAQERMWILDRVEETRAPIYIIPLVLRLRGALDQEALRKALHAIAERHEVLRTSFPMRGERAVQVVGEEPVFDLPPAEPLVVRPAATEQELARAMQEQAGLEVSRPFDLARGPLFRTRLFRIDDGDHLFVLTMHHIVSDGWSMGIVARELSAAYNAFHRRQPLNLSPLPIQYADVALWQRKLFETGGLNESIEAWKKRLDGAPPQLELPTDRVRLAAPSFKGGVVHFAIDRALTTRLKELSKREGVTLYMTLLAAFGAYLSRITNQKDLVLGSPVANRNRALTEPLIGFFVNTLALRLDLTNDPTYLELLAKVRDTTLAAYADQDVPFEKLVEAISPERSLNRQPLVQALFVLQNAPFAPPELEGLSVELVNLDSITAKFDLTLQMQETADGLAGLFEYSSELFDKNRIERMAAQLARVLAAIVERPSTPVLELSLATDEEWKKVAAWSNGTPPATVRSIVELFDEQVARDPNAIALEHKKQPLSYGALDRHASQLAHQLIAQGAGPNKFIGICLPHSIDRFVAVLAVWKSGAAYVPIDPEYPKARIESILEHAKPELMVTLRSMVAELGFSGRVLALDETPAPAPASPLPLPIPEASHAAYVVFTSGSTGRPKGVVLPHRGVGNIAVFSRDAFEITPSSRIYQFASFSFDMSAWDLVDAIANGACLVVPDDDTGRVGEGLTSALIEHRITHVTGPTSAIAQIDFDREYPALKAIISGGEPASRELINKWSRRCKVYNAYGPTEITIICTARLCKIEESGPVPIGPPVSGYVVRILDPQLRPVPIGVYGELYVGGIGIAGGYLGLEEQTNERFIRDPHKAGGRLYKTGDIGRWTMEGEVEYFGRRDHQVKLRGYRIELGEIEAVLESHASVKQALAIVHQNQLVAYVVGKDGEKPEPKVLREHARVKLPDYMTPQLIVLDAFPLTKSLKIDRSKLPDPSALVERAEYVAPSTPAELVLAELFTTLLKKEKIGIHDNFFALGGDSITGLQIIARATQRGLRLRPRQLFQHQTIAALAKVAETGTPINAEQGAVTGSLQLLPSQHRFLAVEKIEPSHASTAIVLDVDPAIELETLRRALAAVERQHDALRLRFTAEGALHASEGGLRVDEYRSFNESMALDLAKGPVTRAALIRLDRENARLLWVAHPLVVDSRSWRILIEDLIVAYGQLANGRPASLPPKTTSLQYMSKRLHAYADSADVRSELDAHLAATERAALNGLPLDDPKEPDLVEDASTIASFLDGEETKALLGEVPSAYDVTVPEVLIAALAKSLAAFTGDREARFDLEGAGREALFDDVDLARTVGPLSATYPVRFRVGLREAPREMLARVKDTLRRIPRGGIGYGLLRYLATDPSIRTRLDAPENEVIFRFLGETAEIPRTGIVRGASREHFGPLRAPHATRPYRIEINAVVEKEGGETRLRINSTFGAEVFRPETIERFGASMIANLRDLIRDRKEPAAAVRVAADFSAARLSAKDLQRVMDKMKKR